MFPASTDDRQSVDSTSYGFDASTSTRGSNSNSRRYSSQSQTTKGRWGKSSNNAELLLKLYSQRNSWKKYGNLTVVCYGTFIIAPVKLWWLMAEIFVLSTVLSFAYEFFFVNWLILVPAVIVAILEWMAFYKTCMRDPGVMTRPKFVDAFRNLISVLSTWNGGPGTKRVIAHPNGQQEELHYCWRCHHFRANQTSHCGTCDCCMILHDHHCPVFGGCVAKNNISSFHTMIISMGVFWIYMIGFNVYKMVSFSDQAPTDGLVSKPAPSQSLGQMGKTPDGTPFTFYVIIAEVIAVFTIPFLVTCVKELFCSCKSCKKPEPSSNLTLKKALVDEILQFAQANQFTIQEIMQLTEILQVQESSEAIGLNDLKNHNDRFTGV